jgi:hypothetical protein
MTRTVAFVTHLHRLILLSRTRHPPRSCSESPVGCAAAASLSHCVSRCNSVSIPGPTSRTDLSRAYPCTRCEGVVSTFRSPFFWRVTGRAEGVSARRNSRRTPRSAVFMGFGFVTLDGFAREDAAVVASRASYFFFVVILDVWRCCCRRRREVRCIT